ncbi:Dam family site-specific DNA-(adenine-N6)-methyltransferase [Erysipelothrix inopinata]|uniref:Site-specific DNA-methyltransferase (adenine-specific) n=1 Tax=Erysipelothrix inopinata TaxID=225084 RepID=A0A7G9RW57_9FIRM|nr:Dam family site-specific DNA-(adenine-N6)-methyltransferase [Erysipelothrix inopinata]QNN59832.1 Dam family site-specific DNA-(adenine-N6)-methyltransferase [Erysipelothrix inopinata]
MEILEELGNRIKEIRDKKGISQTVLAERSGIVREQISRIENGQINATIESVYKLSLGLDVEIAELVSFSNNNIYINTKKENRIKPLVKWAGGKTQLLSEIRNLLPATYNNYFEPFIGGGALFFSIMPENAVINDYNSELVAAYRCFENINSYLQLIDILKKHEVNHNEGYYLSIRELDRTENFDLLSQEEKAARFIYLNKSCFNGLYRVNSKGQFNVPSGKKSAVKAYDGENFQRIFSYFDENNIKILNEDFEVAVQDATSGDFVYFDPPYDSFEASDSFTSYSKNGFDRDDQFRLMKLFRNLDKRGVNVMLSNHNTPYINELYKGFNIKVVKAKRMINSKADGRGFVEEVIITNY